LKSIENEGDKMWYTEDEFKVKIGGTTYINVPNIVVCKGVSLFKIIRSDSDGLIGIDFDIYDENGKKVATIRRGRIVKGNDDDYDIVTAHDHYTITEKSTGKMICDIKKRQMANNVELEVSVHLYTPDGFLFDATPEQTNLPGGNVISGGVMKNCENGIVIN